MYTQKCNLEGKSGIAFLDREGPYAVIANKTLYERGDTSRFAVVNTRVCFVDSVYSSRKDAASYLQTKTS